MPNKQRYCGQLQHHVWIENFRGGEWRNCHSLKIFVFLHGLMTWLVMQRNVWSDIVSWPIRRHNNSTKYLLHASMTTTSREEEMKSVGEVSQVCSQIVLKCLYLARIGRPDILWSVNKLARSITKWTKACDKRLNRLISYIHHTCEYRQYCHVGNTGTVSRLWFRGRSWRFEIHFWRNIVHLRKSYICSNKLDVQETNCCFSQFNRIWNHLFGHWTEIRCFACSGIMGFNCFCSWKCFCGKCQSRLHICKEVWYWTKVIYWPRFWKEVVFWWRGIVHKEFGITSRTRCCWEFAESGCPIFRATTPLSRGNLKSKGHGKPVDTFCCRSRNNWDHFSHNCFCQSAQSLRSSCKHVWRI